jgi:ABC-2 type transport system ATP-binding protein
MDPDKRVSFTSAITDADLAKLGTVLSKDGTRITLRVPESELANVVSYLLGTLKVSDLGIEDPPLEDILRVMFGRHDKDKEKDKAS